MLDLDAASRPVGGTNFALGARATGAVVSTAGTRALLPEGVIARSLAGRTITVLDGWQRAPFEVGIDAFAEPPARLLSLTGRPRAAAGPVPSLRTGRPRSGRGGARRPPGARRDGRALVRRGRPGPGGGAGSGEPGRRRPLPSGGYRMSRDATGIALGFTGGSGTWHALVVSDTTRPDGPGFGIAGWNPQTVLAASFAPARTSEEAGAEAFGLSFASGLDRPLGWQGSGALALGGDSLEFAWRRNVAEGKRFRADLTNQLTHLAVRSGPLLQFDDALLGVGDARGFIPAAPFRHGPGAAGDRAAGLFGRGAASRRRRRRRDRADRLSGSSDRRARSPDVRQGQPGRRLRGRLGLVGRAWRRGGAGRVRPTGGARGSPA